MSIGAFTFVLHSHLPYVRRAGRWPHGEEMIHQAMAETYIPLLNILYELLEEGYHPKLTLGLTPILLEQIADPLVCQHFEAYLEERIALAEQDINRFSRPVEQEWKSAYWRAKQDLLASIRFTIAARELAGKLEEGVSTAASPAKEVSSAQSPADTNGRAGGLSQADVISLLEDPAYFGDIDLSPLELTDEERQNLPPIPMPVNFPLIPHRQGARDHLLYLARWYRRWFEELLHAFRHKYNRNLVKAFKYLQDEGVLDILSSMATHCYSPLMDRDSSLYAQLRTGLECSQRHFGRRPRGIWLPECGYRPAYVSDQGLYKPGIEEFMAGQQVQYFFTDSHVIQGGALVGKAAGDALGPYGAIPNRRIIRFYGPRARYGSTFRPYYVRESPVAVLGRDERTGLQVWSAAHGYPGDYVYREFHRKDDQSGLQYWRVTGAEVDLGQKDFWEPERAFGQASFHAGHFVQVVRQRLQDYTSPDGKLPMVLSAYDTELYGHWWFEGIAWMKEVLRQLSIDPDVELTTVGDYLEQNPPDEALDIPESSWGNGGGHWTWWNPDVYWMWDQIHHSEKRMESLAAHFPEAEGLQQALLSQMARELLLLESSDWPFLVTTGQAKDYAIKRFTSHVARFERLAGILENNEVDPESVGFLQEMEQVDNPFQDVDYHWFRSREGRVD